MEVSISRFTDEMQQSILDKMNKEYLSSGKFVKDQMSVSPKILSSMILSSNVAGTVASATVSSSLFVATVNPATLMTIGAGKGSAVVGAQGIVAQAPFMPVGGAIIPVIAPLMAAQAITSMIMLHQF